MELAMDDEIAKINTVKGFTGPVNLGIKFLVIMN